MRVSNIFLHTSERCKRHNSCHVKRERPAHQSAGQMIQNFDRQALETPRSIGGPCFVDRGLVQLHTPRGAILPTQKNCSVFDSIAAYARSTNLFEGSWSPEKSKPGICSSKRVRRSSRSEVGSWCGTSEGRGSAVASLRDLEKVGKTQVDRERGIVHCVLIQHPKKSLESFIQLASFCSS